MGYYLALRWVLRSWEGGGWWSNIILFNNVYSCCLNATPLVSYALLIIAEPAATLIFHPYFKFKLWINDSIIFNSVSTDKFTLLKFKLRSRHSFWHTLNRLFFVVAYAQHSLLVTDESGNNKIHFTGPYFCHSIVSNVSSGSANMKTALLCCIRSYVGF